jgi:hypothetical protein
MKIEIGDLFITKNVRSKTIPAEVFGRAAVRVNRALRSSEPHEKVRALAELFKISEAHVCRRLDAMKELGIRPIPGYHKTLRIRKTYNFIIRLGKNNAKELKRRLALERVRLYNNED